MRWMIAQLCKFWVSDRLRPLCKLHSTEVNLGANEGHITREAYVLAGAAAGAGAADEAAGVEDSDGFDADLSEAADVAGVADESPPLLEAEASPPEAGAAGGLAEE